MPKTENIFKISFVDFEFKSTQLRHTPIKIKGNERGLGSAFVSRCGTGGWCFINSHKKEAIFFTLWLPVDKSEVHEA